MMSRMPPADSAPAVPRKIVASLAEHLFPDAPRRREVASLKRDALHALEHVVGRQSSLDDERLDGLAKEAGFSTAHEKTILCQFLRHALEEREVGDRRERDAVEARLRDGDVRPRPEADHRRVGGDEALRGDVERAVARPRRASSVAASISRSTSGFA